MVKRGASMSRNKIVAMVIVFMFLGTMPFGELDLSITRRLKTRGGKARRRVRFHPTLGLGAVPPVPPVVPMDYVFTEGTASPYNMNYDYIGNVTPVLISTSEHSAVTGTTQRRLVRLSDGTLYAVYIKLLAGIYQVYVKKSSDDGATWTDETHISTYSGMGSYHQSGQCIAVDSDDYLHVVWHGQATGYTNGGQLWYTKYDGSWSTPIRISTISGMENGGQAGACIAVDSNDYLHVVWRGYGVAPVPLKAKIFYTKYDGSWSTPIKLSTRPGTDDYTQENPCIAVDSDDYLHVVWHGWATGYTIGYQIWYTKYDGSWSTPIHISTTPGMESRHQRYPLIVVDSNDYLYVVWSGMTAAFPSYFQIYYNNYTTVWSTPIRISTYTGMIDYDQDYPSIAVDSDDHLHVVWHGQATGYTDYNKVWYAEYTDSWSTPECLHPIGQNMWPNLRWSRWPEESSGGNDPPYCNSFSMSLYDGRNVYIGWDYHTKMSFSAGDSDGWDDIAYMKIKFQISNGEWIQLSAENDVSWVWPVTRESGEKYVECTQAIFSVTGNNVTLEYRVHLYTGVFPQTLHVDFYGYAEDQAGEDSTWILLEEDYADILYLEEEPTQPGSGGDGYIPTPDWEEWYTPEELWDLDHDELIPILEDNDIPYDPYDTKEELINKILIAGPKKEEATIIPWIRRHGSWLIWLLLALTFVYHTYRKQQKEKPSRRQTLSTMLPKKYSDLKKSTGRFINRVKEEVWR